MNILSQEKERITATFVLFTLYRYGIKKYMSNWYDEEKDCILIELIFNKIILKKFAKEYHKMITFNNGQY